MRLILILIHSRKYSTTHLYGTSFFFNVLFSVLFKRKLRLIFGKMFGGKILMQVINLGLNYTRKHNEDTIGHSWNV